MVWMACFYRFDVIYCLLFRYMTWIIAGLAVTLILLAIAVMIMCFRPREYVLVGRGYGRVPSYGAVVERAE